ncbi:MAG: 2-hydroxyacyl-CoA dehydratase, partial [Lachnospiraceae bacterium]|nr:2-hydroxyacyl-CoA dehydratase [Lachnospiraceae bacterium]
MKDLKHLYYFENLLMDANNELVRQAQDAGRVCVGSVCYQMPEVLMNLGNCFTVRLRAPRTGSMEMGTYYLTSFLCEYSRALLERAIEGGYQFLDCLMAPDGCTMINRCVENMELLKMNDKEHFFYKYLEVPMKADDNGLNLYIGQCKEKILEPLHEKFGVDISDAALRESVERHNKLCRIITELGN